MSPKPSPYRPYVRQCDRRPERNLGEWIRNRVEDLSTGGKIALSGALLAGVGITVGLCVALGGPAGAKNPDLNTAPTDRAKSPTPTLTTTELPTQSVTPSPTTAPTATAFPTPTLGGANLTSKGCFKVNAGFRESNGLGVLYGANPNDTQVNVVIEMVTDPNSPGLVACPKPDGSYRFTSPKGTLPTPTMVGGAVIGGATRATITPTGARR